MNPIPLFHPGIDESDNSGASYVYMNPIALFHLKNKKEHVICSFLFSLSDLSN